MTARQARLLHGGAGRAARSALPAAAALAVAFAAPGCTDPQGDGAHAAPADLCTAVTPAERTVLGIPAPAAAESRDEDAKSSASCTAQPPGRPSPGAAGDAAAATGNWAALRIEWTSFGGVGGEGPSGEDRARAAYDAARTRGVLITCSQPPVPPGVTAAATCFDPGGEYGPMRATVALRDGRTVVYITYSGVGQDARAVQETLRHLADRAADLGR
ncbi:hypothetical protein [Yinghuangia soli]|uniref:DUF3558 domain-containing protein n=1 Tax=Yinghuangia soli TaxID=2908204 RepID=A0AA41Q2V6_9ACTN|nr:hypothetical protein [Yinghuangia soli]MCF2530306.1 hypothetical protein [Yinghuangia soli]